MHELSIAISMIDQILEESDSRGGLDVEVVHLRLGVFSGGAGQRCAFVCLRAGLRRFGPGRLAPGDRDDTAGHLLRCVSKIQDPSVGISIELSRLWEPRAKIVTGKEIEVASLEIVA